MMMQQTVTLHPKESAIVRCVIPYTAKLLRGKTIAVFMVFHPTTNVLRRIVN